MTNSTTAARNQIFQQNTNSAQIQPNSILYDRLSEDPRSIPPFVDALGRPLNTNLPFYDDRRQNYGTSTVRGGGGMHLPNTRERYEDDGVEYSSLRVTQNYAYNRGRDLPGMQQGYPPPKNAPRARQVVKDNDRVFFNQRQRSVHHYDYPQMQEDLVVGERDSNGYLVAGITDSQLEGGYDSITNIMTKE